MGRGRGWGIGVDNLSLFGEVQKIEILRKPVNVIAEIKVTSTRDRTYCNFYLVQLIVFLPFQLASSSSQIVSMRHAGIEKNVFCNEKFSLYLKWAGLASRNTAHLPNKSVYFYWLLFESFIKFEVEATVLSHWKSRLLSMQVTLT